LLVRVSFISSALPDGVAADGLAEFLEGAAAAGFAEFLLEAGAGLGRAERAGEAVFFLGAAAGGAVEPVFGMLFSSDYTKFSATPCRMNRMEVR